MIEVPKTVTYNGKIYVQRNLDIQTLKEFRKKQDIILAGRVEEDFYIEFIDGRKLFVDAGDYIYEDVDKKLKTMTKVSFEKHHEIESVDFVTIKVRREVEDKIKDFMEDFKKYKGQVNEHAMKMTETNDINIIAGHLLLAGIENIRNYLNIVDATNISRQQRRKLDRDRKKRGFAK
jgi:hypothetical protein